MRQKSDCGRSAQGDAKLADREDGFRPEGAPGYRSIIPLEEIISETIKVGVNSKAVEKVYTKLLEDHGNEFRILLEIPVEDIARFRISEGH